MSVESGLSNAEWVRLSLLSPERALLPEHVPGGYVLDVYGGVLTPDVAAERVAVMLVEYVRRCLVLERKFILPEVDVEQMRRSAVFWEPVGLLVPQVLAERFAAAGLPGLDAGLLRDASNLGSFVVSRVLTGRSRYSFRFSEEAAGRLLAAWFRVWDLVDADFDR